MLAGDLKALNDSRKEMTQAGVEEAVKMVETTALQKDKVLVIFFRTAMKVWPESLPDGSENGITSRYLFLQKQNREQRALAGRSRIMICTRR